MRPRAVAGEDEGERGSGDREGDGVRPRLRSGGTPNDDDDDEVPPPLLLLRVAP